MATNGYATAAEVKSWLRITDTDDDTLIDTRIDAASRWIDYHCRRHFYASAAETRYFSPHCSDVVLIDDLASITTLKTDEGEDGTYEVTWASTDYHLEPFSSKVRGNYHPYTAIHVAGNGNYEFPVARKSVQIVGTFGWTAVPHPVREACLLLVSRWYKRGDAPLDALAGPEFGSQSVTKDPDVTMLLAPFVSPPVIG